MTNVHPHEWPDGIGKEHFPGRNDIRRYTTIFSVLLLGAFLAVALSGILGGGPKASCSAENDQVALTFVAPRFIRNGMFFELQIHVMAKSRIDELVIAISEPLIRDITMNTTVPTAAEESFEDGEFRFSFDELEADEDFMFKLDFQINPSLLAGTAGHVAVYDGKSKLAEVAAEITVYP